MIKVKILVSTEDEPVVVGATLKGNVEVFFSNLSFATARPEDAITDTVSEPKNLSFAE